MSLEEVSNSKGRMIYFKLEGPKRADLQSKQTGPTWQVKPKREEPEKTQQQQSNNKKNHKEVQVQGDPISYLTIVFCVILVFCREVPGRGLVPLGQDLVHKSYVGEENWPIWSY